MSILSITFKVKVYIVLFGVKLPRRIISRTNYLHSIVIFDTIENLNGLMTDHSKHG